jgi:BlaI family penicillinase repressor
MKKPSELETKILAVLWTRPDATAREILEALHDGKQRAYTTVLTTLQIMERKALVTRRRDGTADRWRAKESRSRVMKPVFADLVRRVFGGRPSLVVQQFIDDGLVGADELAQMEAMIREERRKKKDAGK